jgi:hypothetical protein
VRLLLRADVSEERMAFIIRETRIGELGTLAVTRAEAGSEEILCASSGMLRRVSLVRIYVSVERIAFIIRVTRIGELGTTLAVTINRS